MKFLLTLFRSSNKIAEDRAATLDHVPVKKHEEHDWRDEAVKEAAVNYGRPFKCAPECLRREVLVAVGKDVTVAVAEPGALPARPAPAPVSIFNKRGRA